MDFIQITKQNLETEHICCALANDNDIQVNSKKSWLSKELDEGLVFLKGNVRGKCFIEYLAAEKAWVPIEADGYLYINCFWISGKYKGQGYANALLKSCIEDAKRQNKKGLVILSSDKKRPFLADPSYLRYKGFVVADYAKPYFELNCLSFDDASQKPRFMEHVKTSEIKEKGFVLYYTSQCPFTAKYVPLLEAVAKKYHMTLTTHFIEDRIQAKQAPTPFTSFSLYYDGKFVTNEILSENKFEKMIQCINDGDDVK